jgi:hypothetical protein
MALISAFNSLISPLSLALAGVATSTATAVAIVPTSMRRDNVPKLPRW